MEAAVSSEMLVTMSSAARLQDVGDRNLGLYRRENLKSQSTDGSSLNPKHSLTPYIGVSSHIEFYKITKKTDRC
jgi:hypothetical protein